MKNLFIRYRSAAALALTLVLAGCVTSLNPLYTERDLVFDPAFVGVWAEGADGSDTWSFEKAGDKSYKVVYTEKGKIGEFEVHLLRLGRALFLDFHPKDDGIKEMNRNEFYRFHFLPVHTFARVAREGSTLSLSFLDAEWLKGLLEKKPNAIRHEQRADDGLVLTASTAELQKFVLEYADEAFGDKPVELQRIRPAESEAPRDR